jgi:hypothetical protein
MKKKVKKEEFAQYNKWYEKWAEERMVIGLKNKDNGHESVE